MFLLLSVVAIGCDGSATDGDAGPDASAGRDAAMLDAGPVDAGPVDAGPVDAGPVDAGPVDAGPSDAGPSDAGPSDAGLDAAPCADADSDGVCDADDRCDGYPDGEDADADDIPDGCDCDRADACPALHLCTESMSGVECALDADEDGHPAAVDCDDSNPDVHPGAVEICDGLDTDCDPSTDEPTAILRDGASFRGSIGSAMSMGGAIEVCGAHVYRWTGDRFANDFTVIGHTSDAAIVVERGRIDFDSDTSAGFESLEVRADPADAIPAIRMVGSASELTLREVTLSGMQGAIAVNRGTVRMTGGQILGSRSRSAVLLDRATAYFTDVSFIDNRTRDRDGGGGAIAVSLGSSVELSGCTLFRNHNEASDGAAGAVFMGPLPGADTGTARLRATSTNWGAGRSDNMPDDLVAWHGPGTRAFVADAITTDVQCVAAAGGNECVSL